MCLSLILGTTLAMPTIHWGKQSRFQLRYQQIIISVRKSAICVQYFICLILSPHVLDSGVLYNSQLTVHPNVNIFGHVDINIFCRSCRRYASSTRGNNTLVSVYKNGVYINTSTNNRTFLVQKTNEISFTILNVTEADGGIYEIRENVDNTSLFTIIDVQGQ